MGSGGGRRKWGASPFIPDPKRYCDNAPAPLATGTKLGADYGDAVGTDSGCGKIQNSGLSATVDPYSGLAANIPANTCSGVVTLTGFASRGIVTCKCACCSVSCKCGYLYRSHQMVTARTRFAPRTKTIEQA